MRPIMNFKPAIVKITERIIQINGFLSLTIAFGYNQLLTKTFSCVTVKKKNIE